ncbi:glycosyltransferase family 2 protein [Leucobacter sp. CSA2]|uniref:Glycosyltransferase family 2 protein n=1 Tax=Leucobacter edaphi TaxID=2796472 RepID=A0A934QAK8_9MICO|nr:glycosyltransferase family 2 protein [Leucobacter edaphi]MBK0421184.1 glycosyltransferase family 2 protein [Leucobacter edaphi]
MHDIELPLGPRRRLYRFLEMLPALVTFGIPIIAVVLSAIDPAWGGAFVLAFVAIGFFRAIRGGVDSVRGYRRLRLAESIDWRGVLRQLEEHIELARSGEERPQERSLRLPAPYAKGLDELLDRIDADPWRVLAPSEVLHAVIIAAYNEPREIVEASVRSLLRTAHGAERIVVVLAHEERGGAEMRRVARDLEREYGSRFHAFLTVEHPADLVEEIPGKGANISWAGEHLLEWCTSEGIRPDHVIVTTLDCDNKVSQGYLDAVSYEFVRAEDPLRVSFQPISLFVGNVWHAPAPARLVAASNSIWNLISTVRPIALRNFASHSQPLSALIEMDFWSRRTIVEDGHQYWRSYFHFGGNYRVVPIHLSITQDAVLANSLPRTLVVQFNQLCRWAYGASDVPYVGVRLLSRERLAPRGATLLRFLQLLESHVTLAVLAPMLAFGVWLPVLVVKLSEPIGAAAIHAERVITLVPEASTATQRVALVGLLAAIPLTILLLPERPEGVPPHRWLGMLLQWVLLPVTLFCYSSASAVTSQCRLLVGAYRERFVVTEKTAVHLARREPLEPSDVDWRHGSRDRVRENRFG